MSINWNDIRAIEGQREGFEELVCQLAGQEKIADQTTFCRIGKPDGGKECYWELANGDIHCWQAKYFVNSLSDSQWAQVDKSVKTTIDNHPRLKSYYIAMPVDRPDGKKRGKSMLQKWKDHVLKWERYASSKNIEVSFKYWGKHELETRLRKPENEGLIHYFFNKTELTDEWFAIKNEESIETLGSRYTPELNFELPFLRFHDGFERGEKFRDWIDAHYETVLDERRNVNFLSEQDGFEAGVARLNSAIERLFVACESISFAGVERISFEGIKDELKAIRGILDEFSNQIHKEQENLENAGNRKNSRRESGSQYYYTQLY